MPHIRVLDKPIFLGPDDLEGLPLQVIAIPWIARSGMMAALGLERSTTRPRYVEKLEERIGELIEYLAGESRPASAG